ncbi:transposase [Ralstonia solanacearum]|nr:transposase [Ralstonia solanacearum]
MNMSTLEKAIQLLGKSERDDAVQALLGEVKVQQPLKRPLRDEDQVNIELNDAPVELCFVEADSLPVRNDDLMEGELVLNTVFLHRQPDKGALASALPFGLSMNLSRAEMRERLGRPSWSSPVLNNDRWVIGDVRVLVCFSEDEKSVDQLAFSLLQ